MTATQGGMTREGDARAGEQWRGTNPKVQETDGQARGTLPREVPHTLKTALWGDPGPRLEHHRVGPYRTVMVCSGEGNSPSSRATMKVRHSGVGDREETRLPKVSSVFLS